MPSSFLNQICIAAVVCALTPMMLSHIHPQICKMALTILSFICIFYLTVGGRLLGVVLGTHSINAAPQFDLTPFWSYSRFNQADIRWQVYMNVFLFIPFGFMLPWCSERLQKLWKVVLIAAAFSILTEAAQYFLRIGFCETDDVIHNTLGAMIGYGYWKLLTRLKERFKP